MCSRTIHLIFLVFVFRSAGAVFSFEELREKARALAAEPFKAGTDAMPEALARLNYDQYRAIQFDSRQSAWHTNRLPFQLEFFHRGGYHKQKVTIHEIAGEAVNPFWFHTNLFKYGTNRMAVPPDLGFAGFRVIYRDSECGEIASFLDASYFRMTGCAETYGTSGRGLAVNTATEQGEEFPIFREYWIQRPAKNDTEITVYALMDSTNVTGAYQFVIRPGKETVAEVKAAVFARHELKEFGIAPFSSMFVYGENGHPTLHDFRPEIHDADGLLMQNGKGEWIWHPLEVGRMLRLNAFKDENPQGFGLMQRDHDFTHYQDTVAKYHDRPSVWVRPVGKWGAGAVKLVQLPTDVEFNDNIVALWAPAEPLTPGNSLDLEYELRWTTAELTPKNLGHTQTTLIGRVDPTKDTSDLRFVVDFAGDAMDSISGREKLTADIQCDKEVHITNSTVTRNSINRTWRFTLEIANPTNAVDLQARLMRRSEPVTETWTFTWQP